MATVDNTQDILDSRDIIERLQELTDLEEAGELDEEQAEELATLKILADEGEGYAQDWIYGAALIREDHFTDYAKELAEEIGAIPMDAPWPARHIDWDAAAEELKQDYTSVDFDGVTYYVR